MVYSTSRFILSYLLSFCFSVLLALRLPRLGKRKLILVLFVRLFDLCLFGFVGFPELVLLFLALWFIVVYSSRRFVVCLSVYHFVLVFFSPLNIAITSLGVERANLSAFRTFVRFVLVWICRFPLPLGVWEGLRFVIVALPGLFSHLFPLWRLF